MGGENKADGFADVVVPSAVDGPQDVPVRLGEDGPVVGIGELEYKAASAGGLAGGVVDSSDDGYEHVIITSVTGVVDAVGDVIEPGAYAETLKSRRPKQINSHDWARPQGKYLWIKELAPGDPGLPSKTPNGDPWPRAAGALVGKVRLFKGTQEGREAAERWSAETGYGADTQFSVGYRATKSRRDPSTGYRHITKMDLFETSEVLWGAMPLSGPMPQPLAAKVLSGIADELDAQLLDESPEAKADDDGSETGEGSESAPLEIEGQPDLTETPDGGDNGPAAGQEIVPPADVEAKATAVPDAGEKHPEPGDVEDLSEEQLRALFDGADLDLDELAAAAKHVTFDDEPGKGTEKNQDAPSAESKRQFSKGERDEAADAGAAMDDGSFPIKNSADLKNAIQALGRAKDQAAAKKHIIKRARALGLTAELPDDWQAEQKTDLSRFTEFLQVAQVLPDEELVGLAEAKAAPPAKQQKPKEQEPKKSGSGGNTDFNSKHPRGETGTPEGGQFVAKGSGSTSSSSGQSSGSGQKPPADGAGKNPKAGAGKGKAGAAGAKKGKKGKKAKRPASESQKLRAKAKELRKAAAAQRKATRLKLKAQLRAQRGAELDRRDAADNAFDKEKEAEDSRRDQVDAALEKETNPAKAKAARKAEAAKRKAFAAQFKAKKSAEKAKRKAFAATLRKQRVAQRASDRASANTARDAADALDNRADSMDASSATAKPKTTKRTGQKEWEPDTLEVKALVAGVEEHPYRPNMTHEACVVCDEFADEPVHTDDEATKTAYTAREDAAWGGDPYPDDVMPGEELDDEDDDAEDATDEAADDEKKSDDGELEAKDGGADRNRGNAETLRRYWRSHVAWGKPGDFKECVSQVGKYMTTEHAKGYCALRHHEVTGEWPGKQAHGGKDAGEVETPEAGLGEPEQKLAQWSAEAEVGATAAHLEAKVGAESMPGSLEEMLRRLRQAVNEALGADERDDNGERIGYVDVEATFPTFVIAARHRWLTDEHAYFQVPFGFDEAGELVVGTPVPVQLRVTAIPEEIPEEAEQVALGAAWRIKTLVDSLPAGGEIKAGRVLSQINTTRLQDAMTQLLAVLEAAGVEIPEPSDKQVNDVAESDDEPVVTPDTTSDGARESKDALAGAEPADGTVRMDPAVYQAGLAFLADTVRR